MVALSALNFAPFQRRIRMLRAWKGLGVGLAIGAGVFAVGTVADYFHLISFDPRTLAAGAGLFAMAMGIGFGLLPVRANEVATSLDRRIKLNDRLTTALEPGMGKSEFGEATIHDAEGHMGSVVPKVAYPIRWDRFHTLALALAVIGSSVFLLGNSGILLPPAAKSAKEAMARKAKDVERVALALEKQPVNSRIGDDEKKLAEQLKQMARDMERGHMNKEEAMRKANEMAQRAKEIGEKRLDQAKQNMTKAKESLAKAALDKMKLDQQTLQNTKLDPEQMAMLQKAEADAGLDQQATAEQAAKMDQAFEAMKMDPSMRKLAALSQEQRRALEKAMLDQIKSLKDQLKNDKLSTAERKELERKLKQQQDLLKNLKLSEDFRKAMEELRNSPEYKELQKLAQKMKAAQDKLREGKELTKEDIEELEKQAEAFAQAMKDPAKKAEIMAQIREMIEALKRGDLTMTACSGLLGAFGMDQFAPDGSGSPDHGGASEGEGKIHHQDKARDPKGTTTPTGISGERDESKGSEVFTTIKAPTMVGSRTSVPYRDVLPKYRTQAERALGQKKIPKRYEKRVKEYFDSLNGGK